MQFPNPIVTQLTITDNGQIAVQIGPGPKIYITGNGEIQIQNPTTGQELDLRLSALGNPIVEFDGRTSSGGKVFKLTFDEQNDNKYQEYSPSFSQSETQSAAGWYVSETVSGIGFGFDPTDQELKVIQAGTETFLDWTNLTLTGGWSASAGYYTPQYRYTPDGLLELRGNMTAGTTADGTAVITMPVVPAKFGLIRPAIEAGGTVNARLFYNTDGKIYVFGCAGTTKMSLDGMRFSYK